MPVVRRRVPSMFWRRAGRDRLQLQPVGPALPLGTLVRVPDRGDVFVRYAPGPPGAGRAVWRTWYSMVKCGSSTHTGRASDRGTVATFCR